jgi:hypothetical protein
LTGFIRVMQVELDKTSFSTKTNSFLEKQRHEQDGAHQGEEIELEARESDKRWRIKEIREENLSLVLGDFPQFIYSS